MSRRAAIAPGRIRTAPGPTARGANRGRTGTGEAAFRAMRRVFCHGLSRARQVYAARPPLLTALAVALAPAAGPAFGQQSGAAAIEEVVVTGTYIRRQSQFDTPSPLVTIGRDDLAALGVNEISDVIEDLTINTGSQNNPDAFTQNVTTGTSNINLRGLGVDSTLVLVNGRRQTQSAVPTDRGENFVDTSSLPPMIAFDRIELLKDGAAALYGSEAVAGVVNFITRSGFEGFEFSVELQTVDDHPQEDMQLSGLYGIDLDDTSFLLAFSALDRKPLSTADRRLSTRADDLSQAGNPGSFLVPSLPANPAYALVWTAAFDTNRNGVADALEPQLGLPPVAGAALPVFADPDCATIAAQDPKVIPGIASSIPSPAGDIPIGLCQFDFGDYFMLVPEERRASAYAELVHDFSDRTTARAELHFASNEAERNNSPSFPFAAFPTVAAVHPDNPYGTDVNFIGRIVGAGGTAVPSIHQSDTWRLAAALTNEINARWDFELGFTISENDFFVTAKDTLIDRFDLAIRGFGGFSCDPRTGAAGVGNCEYFNPFGSSLTGTGTRNSAAMFDYLLGDYSFDATNELATLDGFVTGQLGDLAGGPIGIALGAQLRDEELTYDYDGHANRNNYLFLAGNPDFSGSRDIAAVFVELSLPVGETVELQLAGRYEDYGDGVDSTDPKFSFLWQPNASFSLRGSLGTSFRAPSVYQAFGVQTTLQELIDPTVGAPQFFPVRTQPDPSGQALKPAEADVANVGLSWSISDRVELGIDYWLFDYSQVIVQENAQVILNAAAGGDPQAQAQVLRDPATGLLLRVNSHYANASSLETDGFDLSIVYETETANGSSFAVGADATLMSTYDLIDPQAGRVDGLGRRNFANFATSTPELRANAFVNWRRDNHGIDVFLRYVDSYEDDQVGAGQGPESFRPIDSFVTVDAQYSFRFDRESGPTISVGAINLFAEDPPHVATNGGYDSKVHDPRGRLLYAKASFGF